MSSSSIIRLWSSCGQLDWRFGRVISAKWQHNGERQDDGRPPDGARRDHGDIPWLRGGVAHLKGSVEHSAEDCSLHGRVLTGLTG